MKQIIDKNYEVTKKRGLINSFTNSNDFLIKIKEEVDELEDSFENYYFDELELADIILVCLNMAKHYEIDIEKVLEEKIQINEARIKTP